ncbi:MULTISPECIES: heat-inducible transcriptional repressor HrcA [Nocardiopsis]|uniref:Heat-inducible transcription repressor HrcA n=1 Tax=Nocardiopsis sinuspersici TaxID=501010 RepID=A0A1V3BWY9_9ACTN|nr:MULTISPECIES: heat-inducible transcriptional repressor HrcA [Nocardiopsis]NYH54164.1 heat-inducible transcriptional repressor [Nocardiopsis sinuspersici]OOC52995.1 heat-inducible transcriptional repressor HrcA [Nocardiopsis sinuspersici]
MLDERKLAVLRAVVEDFVNTNEPVGSKALADRHRLGVSPATIRNDMVALEEDGYITQPHTSAGRVPTDKGYRLFVDRLSSVKPLSSAERRAIESFLTGAVDLDEIVARTVRLLSQLTRQVAIVQYPSLTRSSVQHVELIPLGTQRVMMVVITNTGRVEQRVIDGLGEINETAVNDLRGMLNRAISGLYLGEVPGAVEDLPSQVPPEHRHMALSVLSVLLESLVERHEEKIVLAGTANLAAVDFAASLRDVLEALEENMVLIRLLGEAKDPSMLTVRIGAENFHEGLRSTSVVSADYGVGNQSLAKIGVVGPTRMDYPGTMGAVRAVARYIGQILAGQ